MAKMNFRTTHIASIILVLLLGVKSSQAQIRFDVSKYKVTEVDKLEIEETDDIVFLPMRYGDHEFSSAKALDAVANRMVRKVLYVYSDYPKDFDYSELGFKRFAELYTLKPEVFNKPWIEWEIIKQVDCQSSAEAASMFHGFVLILKQGPAPNVVTEIPSDIQEKLKDIEAEVEYTEIKSSLDLMPFLSSKGVKVSNVKYNKTAIMRFYEWLKPGPQTIVKGLMLTTGNPKGALGPNNSPSTTGINTYKTTMDKDLVSVVKQSQSYNASVLNSMVPTTPVFFTPINQLFDPTILEFDLQANADTLIFKYAFASEEYPEFLQYNDVFGLFISGRDINDNPRDTTINLASLPDHDTPISVSSINHLNNSEYYIPNDYTADLRLFKSWQFDGFTHVMTVKVAVKRRQTYHLKFAISDYGDPLYDSAIFIDGIGVKQKKLEK